MATQAQINAIIQRIAPYCQKYAKQYGYKVCSPAIAQALQESLGKYEGLSYLAYKYHNLHGLKCGKAWLNAGKPSVSMKTGEEYTVGKITQINDFFRVFSSEEAGIEGYYQFLNTSRYSNLKACTSYSDYLYKIKQAGYCTSSTYVQSCIGKIKQYGLDKYDNLADLTANDIDNSPKLNAYTPNDDLLTTFEVGKVYTLNVDLYVRSTPAGSKLKFDALTQDAKKNGKYDSYGNAILKEGTKVTCKKVSQLESSTWIMIPSGWICGVSKDKVYLNG